MQLKTLELNNFKSFKNKTVISFMDGLTVITGLNGAGKSNIIDAINFALGKSGGKAKRLIYEGEKETSVKIVLTDENENLLTIYRTIDIKGYESLYINGKLSENRNIPDSDFNFELLDSNSHNQLDSSKLKDFMEKLKDESNRKQFILVSTEMNILDYANQLITVQKTKNQSEIIESQCIK